MRLISQKFVDGLHCEVTRIEGNWPAVRSEIEQFENSERYRRGLRQEFERRWHHPPSDTELKKYFFRLARQRARMFRWFTRS